MFESIMSSVITILGIISLIFGVLGGMYSIWNWFIKKYFPIKIKLFFDKTQTFHKRIDQSNNVQSLWVHVRTYSKRGHPRLRNCTAYLTAAKSFKNKIYENVPDFLCKLPLTWGHTGGSLVCDLFPDESANIDLFFIPQSNARLIVSTNLIPSGTQKFFPPGNYLFTIVAFADNASYNEIIIKVKFDGINIPEIEEYKQ